jgi:colanic acid/amylovoran biosynthesis protein
VSKAPDLSPKILLVNFHSTMNAGDLGLLISAREFLLRVFPSCEITVSANWPNEPAYRENGFTVVPSPWSLSGLNMNTSIFQQLRNFLCISTKLWILNSKCILADPDVDLLRSAYLEADIIVSVPGNQFYSSGRFGWPFPVSILGVLLAQRYKKPLVILPQSIGPLRRWWEKMLLRRAYGKARRIFLRDEKSLELAKEIGLPSEKVSYSPDLALGLQPGDPVLALEILQEGGVDLTRTKLGVTLISKMNRSFDSKAMQNYYAVLEVALSNFARDHLAQIIFFDQVSGPTPIENDSIPTARMVSALRRLGIDAIHVNRSLTPDLLKACYGQMDAFLATRLHSGIYAIGMTVPTLFIGYLTKTQGIVRSLNIEDSFIDISDLNETMLRAKLEALWVNREEKRTHLTKTISQSKLQQADSIELLRKDFSNG